MWVTNDRWRKTAYRIQEKVDMRPFVDVEENRIAIDGDFENKVGRCTRLDGLPRNAIVLRMYQGFVEIEHQGFPLDKTYDK